MNFSQMLHPGPVDLRLTLDETAGGGSYDVRHVEWWRQVGFKRVEIKTYGNHPTVNRHIVTVEEL